MIEQVLLRGAEEPDRKQRSPARSRHPTRNFHGELRYQRRRGTGPLGFIHQFDLAARRDKALHFTFEILLALGFIYITFLEAALLRL